LCEGSRFPTPDGRAHFSDALPTTEALPAGRYHLSTRRGKQFNSMVWRDRDPLTGATRDALFLSAADATGLGVSEGETLVIRAEGGATLRARAHLAPIRAGNVQMFWPEANVLIAAGRRDPVSGVPDYNAVVEISRG
jgi:anaerobic selenocysteine-containing dehydrogenase